MRVFVSSLMAVLLLANAVFGCCRHRMLACALADGASTTVSKSEECCQHEQEERRESQRPCGCCVECYGACTYLPSESSDTDLAVALLPLDLVPLIDLCLTTGYEGPGWPGTVLASTGISPPVRLHLLHQSLLV